MNRSWGADPPRSRSTAHAYSCSGRTPRTPPARTPPALTVVPSEPDRAAAPVTNPQHLRLADELAPMVEVWQRLLALHRPDRTGRCRTCTQGGTGLPSTQWPCALHGIAALARLRHGQPGRG
jgi:hypothetical protein